MSIAGELARFLTSTNVNDLPPLAMERARMVIASAAMGSDIDGALPRIAGCCPGPRPEKQSRIARMLSSSLMLSGFMLLLSAAQSVTKAGPEGGASGETGHE